MKTYLRIYASVLVCLLFAVSAFAGDPVPDVTLTLTNTSTGAVIHTKTDASGDFTTSLESGTYTVCVSYADCVKAASVQSAPVGGKAPVTADTRSFTSGRFCFISGPIAMDV